MGRDQDIGKGRLVSAGGNSSARIKLYNKKQQDATGE